MTSEWTATDFPTLGQPGGCLVQPLPPRRKNKPQAKQSDLQNKIQTRVYQKGRPDFSQNRRFRSTDRTASQTSNVFHIIKQQPGGWYQADHVTRNQSLEPGLPEQEPIITHNVGKCRRSRKKRNRRKRRQAMCESTSERFPSPSTLGSTLGLMRQLPFARLHYKNFCRLFPSVSPKLLRERSFCADATRELPFSKYPDEYLHEILTSKSESVTKEHKQHFSRNFAKDYTSLTETKLETTWNLEVDTHGIDEMSTPRCSEKGVDALETKEIKEEKSIGQSSMDVQAGTTCDTSKPSTPTSADFISLSENRSSTPIDPAEGYGSMPYIDDNDGESNSVSKHPTSPCLDFVAVEGKCTFGQMTTVNESSRNDITILNDKSLNESNDKFVKPTVGTEQSEIVSKLSQQPQAEDIVPRTQAAVNLFESASFGQMAGALKCSLCGQLAYPAERFEANGQVVHMSCFRCHRCSTMLQRAAWNQRGLKYYCNPCHRRIALQTLRH